MLQLEDVQPVLPAEPAKAPLPYFPILYFVSTVAFGIWVFRYLTKRR